ncbi:MAG: hypothetical protein ACTSP4_11510 [Candidatus Hodarchaeales archaeon]
MTALLIAVSRVIIAAFIIGSDIILYDLERCFSVDDFDALIKVKKAVYMFTCYNRNDDYEFGDLDALMMESAVELEKEFAGYARDIRIDLDNYDENSQMAEVIVIYNYYPLEDDDNELEIINKEIVRSFEKIGLDVEGIQFLGIRE